MEYLFNPSILETIDIADIMQEHLKDKVSDEVKQNIHARPLRKTDHESYMKLLRELTDVGTVDSEKFSSTFSQMIVCPNTYFILVLEDLQSGEIMAAATLLVELKFIHSCTKRGHVEDVVVSSRHRGKNLGKLLVAVLIAIGRHIGCYKITLDCHNEKVGFYEKTGFKCIHNNMCIRFDGVV